jgi:hypothetical protein
VARKRGNHGTTDRSKGPYGVARRKPARSVTTLAPQVLSGASALALQRQRRGKTWGNKGPDADSDAERFLERRLAYLTTTRVLTGWERNRTSYDCGRDLHIRLHRLRAWAAGRT